MKHSGAEESEIDNPVGMNEGSEYEMNNEMLGTINGDTLKGETNIESFLLGAQNPRESDDFDDNKSDCRSATDLAPFKKDIGNRFSKIEKNTRESFFQANPLAKSAASNYKVSHSIYEDLDESRDS